MIRPLPLYIGLRYIRAKRRNGFISFISFASTLGIALGVAVLLTVLSVMNGFDEQIRTHFFALARQVTLSTEEKDNSDWQQWQQTLAPITNLKGSAPFVSGEGMLIKGKALQGVQVEGIVPNQETQVSQLARLVSSGSVDSLVPGKFNVVITESLAQQLNLQIGDPVNVFTSQATTTPLGMFPRYRQFTVSGIYNNNSSSTIRESVYIAMEDAQKLFAAGPYTSGLHLKLTNPYKAPKTAVAVAKLFPQGFTATNWTVESGAFFQALTMEKTMMFIILLLIIAIAAFNLVAMLVMVVHEKQADIAILRTLGAAPHTIRNIFIMQGMILGVFGTLIGLVAGIILTLNVNPVVNFLQQVLHVQFIASSAYSANYLPVKLLFQDIIIVCAMAFGLSLLATLYPARLAFRIQPAEALRYE
jgi:lipoprotein-releasing system permease protein